jgi:hypothetical protein
MDDLAYFHFQPAAAAMTKLDTTIITYMALTYTIFHFIWGYLLEMFLETTPSLRFGP